jgi:hypothetical protein
MCLIAFDEVSFPLDMTKENNHHNSAMVIAPTRGGKAEIAVNKDGLHFTLVAATVVGGQALPCILICQSDAKGTILARDLVSTGVNYLSANMADRFPGLPPCTFRGKVFLGRVYISVSGGMTEAIMIDMIKNVFAPIFPERSLEWIIGTLCDAFGNHWKIEVFSYICSYTISYP